MARKISRRGLMIRSAALAPACATFVLGGRALAVPDACHDKYFAKDAFAAKRYQEESDNPREVCSLCMYFKSTGACGDCSKLEAQVSPKGSCDDWVSRN